MKSAGQIKREGERFIRRAKRLFPDFDVDPVSALFKEAEQGDVLLPSTIRRYRPSYRIALEMLDPTNADRHYGRLSELLDERRGKPEPVRGATGKVTHVEKSDAMATFERLKLITLELRSRSAFAAALYVLVVPRVSIRPIELLEAEVVGKELRVQNAKWRPGLPTYRVVSLKRFPDTFIEAARWLCVLARLGVDEGVEETEELRFEHWRNRVAESLARASTHELDQRLSLYAFRHLGIATWKAAGFSEAEIAALAGHLNLSSARKYYAPASSGWKNETILAELGPSTAIAHKASDHATQPFAVTDGIEPNEVPASSSVPKDINVDDFPMPVAQESTKPGSGAFDTYRTKLESQADDALRIAERLKSTRARHVPGRGNNDR